MREKKRKFTARQRLEIVLDGLRGEQSVAEICRKHQISPTLYYHWRDRLFENADRLFEPARRAESRQVVELEAEAERLKAVIAEITAENLELKKFSACRIALARVRL
jgi:transposase